MSRRLGWQQVFLLAVIAGALHMLFYAWWVPPWQFPDEPRHFEYVRLVGEWGRAAGYNEEDPTLQAAIIRSMARFDFWRFGFAIGGYVQHRDQTFAEIWLQGYKNVHRNAALYYFLTGFMFSFLPREAMLTQLLLTRLFSVLVGVANLVLIGLIGFSLGGWRRAAMLTVFAALLPGHAFINAAVNNDGLAEFFSLLTVLAGILVVRRGGRARLVLLLLLGLTAALFTKRTTVFLVPFAGITLIAGWVLHTHRGRASVARRAAALGGVGLFVLAGLAYAVLHFHLLMLNWSTKHMLRTDPVGGALRRLASLPWRENLTILFQSFWARLGWLNVLLPGWMYTGLVVLTVLAALGWGARVGRGWEWWRRASGQARVLALTILLTLVAQWLGLVARDIVYSTGPLRTVPQGRYLYPFLPIYALYFTEGWAWWWKRLRLPPMSTSTALMVALVVVTVLNMVQFYFGT